MNYKSVAKLLAYIQLFIAGFMLIPMFMSIYYQEQISFYSFLASEAIVLVICLITLFITRDTKNLIIKAKDSYLFVTLTWVIVTFFGALPLYFSSSLPSFAQCYFEIMSGYTTTGASAMTNVEAMDMSILFWRSLTNWIGGMGIVVLFVAVLPFLGVSGVNLVGAEAVGPTKDKLTPKIQQTAIILWAIYVGLSVIQVILLLFKIPLFDALCVTFGAMSAGGFSVKNSSIASYNSAYVDIVVSIFMILAGVNFALYFKILQGKFKTAFKDGEFRVYISLIIIMTSFSAIMLISKGVYGLFDSFRHSFFQVASVISATGFASADFVLWPSFCQMLLLFLFFVGGCAGSAGGGIKVVRVATTTILAKNAITKKMHPNAIVKTRLGSDIIKEDIALSIAGFVGCYIFTGLIGAIIFSTSGVDLITAFSASFLLLGNIGVGLGAVGPSGNFAIFNDAVITAGSFIMLVGRLELFTVYALFAKSFWKK